MLRARLATAAVAIPLLLAIILVGPPWAWMGLVAVIGSLGVVEYAAMAFPNRTPERLLTILGGSAVIVCGCLISVEAMLAAIALTTIAGAIWVLLGRADFEAGFGDLGLLAFGILYLGVLVPHFALVRAVGDEGRYLVLMVIAVGMAGDTSGYFAGRQWGRRKLMPRVSPGKTVEGAIGIMVGSAFGALAANLIGLAAGLPVWSATWAVAVALVMRVLGQLGDLAESVIKRTFHTKESGSIFPGHGGVLDRIDSLLFPVVFLYYVHRWIG